MHAYSLLATGDAAGDPRTLLCRLARLTVWELPHMAAAHWRLYVPLDAGGVLVWQGRERPLTPGRWLLVAPGTDCAARLHRPFRKAWLHALWSASGVLPVPGLHEGPLPRGLVARLRESAAGGDAEGRALGLLLQARLRLALAELPAAAFRAPPQLSPAIGAALARIRRDPAAVPGNTALARALGMHPASLIRRFTAEVGEPPQRAAMRFRLEQAAALLADGEQPIEAIAVRCGFGDRHHFSRAFRRHWHQPPAAFRRAARGE